MLHALHPCLIVQTYPDVHVFGAAGVLWQSGQHQRATTAAAVCQGYLYCRSGWRPCQGSIKHSSHTFLAMQSKAALMDLLEWYALGHQMCVALLLSYKPMRL